MLKQNSVENKARHTSGWLRHDQIDFLRQMGIGKNLRLFFKTAVCFLSIFLTAHSSATVMDEAAPNADLEGQYCITCAATTGNDSNTLSPIRESVQSTSSKKQCDMKTLLVDTKQKSILQDFGMSYDGNDPMVIVGRSSLTCLYGALEGGAKSIRDLVMLIPQILGLSFDALKAVSGSLTKSNLHALLSTLEPQKVIAKGERLVSVTKDSISSAFQSASAKLYSAYEQGGATGAVAAVAQAAYSSSPHQIVGKFLADLAVGIGHAVANEWAGFTCLPPEAMSQLICEMIGYVGADVLTGKIAVSALSKAPKFLAALAKLKPIFEDKPIIGQWLMRDLKRTEFSKCAAIEDALWMTDAKLNLQAKAVDVAIVDKKLFARGIDPNTKVMGCFEVAGSFSAAVMQRIASTELRAKTAERTGQAGAHTGPGLQSASETNLPASAAAPAAQAAELSSGAAPAGLASVEANSSEFYSASSRQYARNLKDFVTDVNDKSGLSIRSKQSLAISQRLEKSPVDAEKYGRVLEQLGSLRQESSSAISAEAKKTAAATLRESEELVKNLNRVLSKPGLAGEFGSVLNLNLLEAALDEAKQMGNVTSIKVLNRAMSEFMKNIKPKTSIQDAIAAWEKNLKKRNSRISDDTIQRARRCLFAEGNL